MDYRIDDRYEGCTLKQYLFSVLRLSGSMVTSLKKTDEGLRVNGIHVTVRYILRAGDLLSVLEQPEEDAETAVPVRLPVTVLYEDRDLIVINKPPLMPTHPSHGHYEDTAANALAYLFARRGEPFVFRSVSRLDRDTSGVLPVAKNRTAAYHMHTAHLRGQIEKEYLAVLCGHLTPVCGEIRGKIRRAEESVITRVVSEDGEDALTRYTVLAYGTAPDGTPLTAVSAMPVTGRTHQLRVHFASLGTPIAGDFLYGEENHNLIPRQALHAAKLTFPHPSTGQTMTLTADIPEDLRSLLQYCRERV